MASSVCRFCSGHSDVFVDLMDTSLHEKLTKYFPLIFDPEDFLPKVSCIDCADFIQQVEAFVLRAQEVEQGLLERMGLSQTPTPKPKPLQNIKEVLQKLKGGSLTVRKISKNFRIPKHENVVSCLEPYLMKMEVLDGEAENIPKADFVQYNYIDEDAPTEAKKTFGNIVKIESFSSGESDAYAESSGDDYEPPKIVKKRQRRLSNPKPDVSPPKNIATNATDPCQFVCVTCKGMFGSFEELQNHRKENTGCKKTICKCNTCGEIYPTRRALAQHRLSHREKPKFMCDQCGKVYTNTVNLKNHKAQIHGDKAGHAYKCCQMTFATRQELSAHVVTHGKLLNVLCDVCGKNFTSKKALKSHSISHTNIRPFCCNVCHKAFRSKLLLIEHCHVHTGIKIFNCDICDRSFAKKMSLRKHYKQHTSEPVCWSSTGEKLLNRSLTASL